MKRAIFLFPVRKTFVAPIFPLPIFLISPNPDIFVSINPKGIDLRNIQKQRLKLKLNNLNHKSFYYFIFENLIHEGNLTINVSC